MPHRTLITGFGPFLNVADNPSAHIARALGRPHQVLEVSYEAVELFIRELDTSSFDRLMLMGVASGRSHICPELFARNTYGATADVSGSTRAGEIQPSGPLLLEGTLFDGARLAPVLVAEPRMRVSMDAGSYLCNFTYYRALSALPDKQVGFVHVPDVDKIRLDEQIESIGRLLEHLETACS